MRQANSVRRICFARVRWRCWLETTVGPSEPFVLFDGSRAAFGEQLGIVDPYRCATGGPSPLSSVAQLLKAVN